MKKKKINDCSLDEEIMMCCAYRYAIGRHTYVSCIAPYIGSKYYDKLSDERLDFTASDIRNEISRCLEYGGFKFHYDGTVNYEDRMPLTDLLNYLSENNISKEDVKKIEGIEVYKESYAKDAPKLYRVTTISPNRNKYVSSMDIDDLLCWDTLASFFDKKNYKKLKVKFNGETQEVIAFETWHNACEPVPGKENIYHYVDFKWVKHYTGVDDYLEKGEHSGYIIPELIESVEDYDATKV